MCREGKFNFIYKTLVAIVAACGVLLLPFGSFAQDLPCEDQDPTGTNPCPLDTWVWVLVVAAVVFGAWQLYRRQKMQSAHTIGR
jgi:hypothetical protein